MNGGRIAYEEQVFSGVPQVAEILDLPASARRSLLEEGVPRYFFFREYSADQDLSVIHLDGYPPFVRFGSDSRGILGADSVDGKVVHISDTWQLRITFVNATIGKFAETARLLADRFPYGVSSDWWKEARMAADVMRGIIHSVDERAAVRGGYWPDFADEIAGHFYGLGEIQEWYQYRRSPSHVDDVKRLEQRQADGADDRLF